jgi:hypothetical protein
MSSSAEKTAVMVVRAWLEGDQTDQLRARITQSLDIAATDELVSSASTIDQVCAMVRSWLEAFIARSYN